MPSIALFIRELLAEDKYSPDFTNRIEERIQGLNAAQLQGMYNHLKLSQKNAKSEIWKYANQEIMNKIEDALKLKVDEAQKQRKVLEEYYLKQRQKAQAKKVADKEKIRVMEMIDQSSLVQAEQEIKDNEQKRQAAERMYILQEVGKAEEKRNFWWKVLFVIYICAVAALSYLMMNSLLVLIPSALGLTFITIYLAYRAHLWTDIKPIVISPEYLQSQIESKAEQLKKEAISNIRERERKFLEQQRKETLERRRLRAERKAKQMEEIELLERERINRVNQAKLLLAKSMKQNATSITSSKEVEVASLMSNFSRGSTAKVVPLLSEDPMSPLSVSDDEIDQVAHGGSNSRELQLVKAPSTDLQPNKLSALSSEWELNDCSSSDGVFENQILKEGDLLHAEQKLVELYKGTEEIV